MKQIWIRAGMLALAAFLLVTVFVPHPASKTAANPARPIVALVNEDQPDIFNKQQYDFGRDFVDLVSTDNTYDWQVLPRNVADKAYNDKSVSAVIYLPGSLTHDILTLQDIDPTQADVDYKVQADSDAVSRQGLQDKILGILKDFNTNIVKVYYGSIAGNVAEAQGNMNTTVASQANLVNVLTTNIYPNLNTTNQGYDAITGIASGLQQENSAWIAQQNGFTDAVKNMLTSTSSSLAGQQPSLSDYSPCRNRSWTRTCPTVTGLSRPKTVWIRLIMMRRSMLTLPV